MDRRPRHLIKVLRIAFECFVREPTKENQRNNSRRKAQQE